MAPQPRSGQDDAGPIYRRPKDYIAVTTSDTKLALQRRIVRYLMWVYSCLLAAAVLMFFLQGFHA